MSEPLTFGSLFAGIGGMDLGLERSGLECRWQVEIDPFARRVLAKHWPDVRRHDDVRTFPPDASEDWYVDVVAGGFPCQDISYIGAKAGLAGERSGLWHEFARVVRTIRPRYVLVENVSALLTRGLDAVLGTLASLGYDAEWHCVPAAAVGAPHARDRVFILGDAAFPRADALADRARVESDGVPVAQAIEYQGCLATGGPGCMLADFRESVGRAQWERDPADDPESGVGRVAHGVPGRVDRLRGLGNAVVPQVAELIGRRLIELHEAIERKGEGR